MRRGHDIGTGRVHLRVNDEGRRVHRPVALDDLTVIVHQDEVFDPNLLEVHAERIHPEVVEQFRIAGGDVTGHALVEPEMTEETEGGREALLAVPALVLDARELRICVGDAI